MNRGAFCRTPATRSSRKRNVEKTMSDSSQNKKPESDRTYEPKPRKCLMCRKEFHSSWPGERVCKRCKETAAWNDSSLAA